MVVHDYSIADVKQYLCDGKIKKVLSLKQRKSFLKYAKNFQYFDGILYYVNACHKLQVLSTDEEKKLAFRDVHNSNHGAHVGLNNTRVKLKSAFYWLGMVNDITKWVKECDKCQRMEKIKTCAPELKPIKVNELWEILGIDLIGPLPLTTQGNKYILTVTDLWSKYVEAFSIPEKSASFVSKCLTTLFYRFGPPKKIISDQGREFVNDLNEFLFSTFNVKHLITSAYHPQTNGQDERTNQTIKRALSKVANETQDNWDTLLEPVLFGLRTCVQSSTKYTPFFLMFGREARLFSTLALNDSNPNFIGDNISILKGNATEDQIQERMDSCISVHAIVDKNICIAQKKMQKYYNKKQLKGFKSFNFKVGDKVLVRNYKKIGRKGSRMEHNWLGPATINDFKPTGAVVSVNGKIWKSAVALPNMKPYLEENQGLIYTDILKEHSYCLQNTDSIYINEESYKENSSCSSTALGKRTHAKHTSIIRYDLGRKKIKVNEVRKSSSSPSNYNSNKMLVVAEEKPVDFVLKSVESDFEDIVKKSECRRSEFTKVYHAVSVASNFYSKLSAQAKAEALNILKNPSGWLDDTLIDIAHSLLSFQFPRISGFQSSCIFSSFNSVSYIHSESYLFVQIVNVRKSHWVLLSNVSSDVGSHSKCVQYYDSLFNSSNKDDVPLSVHTVARSYLNCKTSNYLTVEVMNCPTQKNGNDCGLFAIANATALCNGIDPSLVLWRHNEMRQHYLKCIENGKLEMFPFVTVLDSHKRCAFSFDCNSFCMCRQENNN